jgi:chromosome partitioning protein
MRIALINQKGGVGKTTSTVNLGVALAKRGKRVLLIDLDPQAHMTISLGVGTDEDKPLKHTVYDVLKGDATADEAIYEREGDFPVWVLPASLDLSAAEIELSGQAGREFLLREAMESIHGYDYILIDCSPSLGLLTLNALTYSQYLLIPLQVEYLALQGIAKLIEVVNVIKKRLNKNLEVFGVFATRFDSRKNLSREIMAKVQDYFGDKLFTTKIHDNVSVAEAPSHGKTVFEYKPECVGAKDYLDLADELILRRPKE